MSNLDFFIRTVSAALPSPQLNTLIHFVTDRCNAHCDFCFYKNQLNSGRNELTLDEVDTLSKKLGTLQGLLIGGGEPFLRQDLIELVGLYIRNCNVQVVQIPTNGSLTGRAVNLAETLTAKFPKVNIAIQVSIDAIGEKHDNLRRLPGLFNKAQQTLKALTALRSKDRRFRVLVVSVLSGSTQAGCRELARHVQDTIKPDLHWFEPARELSGDSAPLDLSAEDIAFLEANLRSYLTGISGTSTSIYANTLLNRMMAEFSMNNFAIALANALHQTPWPMPCVAGRKIAVLYPDGALAPCELKKSVVNIRDCGYDILKALKHKDFAATRAATRRHQCDCSHGCFIPLSARMAPSQWFSLLKRSVM